MNALKGISISCCFCIITLYGCKTHENSESEKTISAQKVSDKIVEAPVSVKTIFLKEEDFSRELIANGKLEALQRTDLKFATDGIINQIFVKESNRVRNGQRLAILDNIQQLSAYSQTRLRLKQALLDYDDQLLRLGYRLADSTKIDQNTKNIARLRSGLSNAELEMQKSGTDLKRTTLIAPFSGKIANLKAKVHSGSSSFEYFCTLINDNELLVDFLVLEQELALIKNSDKIIISPFNKEEIKYVGKIETINPLVNKSGMINVKARIHNKDGLLLDGMSVKIIIQQAIPKQLSVPKNAVLDRQGKKVVFTAIEDKNAYWNYVDIAYENSTEYAIKSGLKKGDKVIYEGNFNLAHDNSIKVTN